MPYDEHASNVLSSRPGRRTLPFKQSMNRGGVPFKRTLFEPPTPYGQSGGQQYRPVNTPLDSQTNATGAFGANELREKRLPFEQSMHRGGVPSWPSAYFRPPSNIDQLGSQAQEHMEAYAQQQRALDAAVDAYQFQGSPMPGVGQGYAMPGAEGRAARHEARVRQGLDQGLSYEQAHRAAANTGQLEIHNDAMNYRNFQRDRMPGQMRTNAYRGIGDQGGQNSDLASNLFGNIDANNVRQIGGYLGGELDTPILDRDPVTGMMSPSQSGITKGDLMGSRGRFYAEREAGREAARQQVNASRQNMIDNLISRQRDAGLPSYGTPLNAVGVDQEPRSTSTVRWTGNGFQLDGGADGRARAAQQDQERLETLQRRREEIGEEMGLDGPANSMDVKINSRRKRSDILKQRNRAKFLARNPGRKYPGGTVSQAQPEQTGVPDDIGQLIIGPAATAIAEGQELNETQKQGIYDRARAYLGSEQANTGKGKLTNEQKNKFIDNLTIAGHISKEQADSLRTGENIPGIFDSSYHGLMTPPWHKFWTGGR